MISLKDLRNKTDLHNQKKIELDNSIKQKEKEELDRLYNNIIEDLDKKLASAADRGERSYGKQYETCL